MTFLFFIVAPFLYTEAVIDPSNTLRAITLPLLLLLFFVSGSIRCLPANYVLLYLAAFFGWALMGLSTAFSSAEVYFELSKFLAFMVSVLFFTNALYQDKTALLWALRVTITTAIFSIGYLLAQLPNLNRSSVFLLHPFYEHHNTIAAALLAITALQAYDYFVSHKTEKWHAVINFVLLVVLLLILQVRSVYLGLAVGAALYAVLMWSQKKMVKLLPSAVIILALSFMYTNGSSSATTVVEAKPGIQSTESLTERLQFWSKTMAVIKEHPLVGCGLGNWQFNYAKTGIGGIKNLEKGITAQHPHNEALSIWAETGTIGLVLVVLFAFFLFRQIRYAIGHAPTAPLFIVVCGLVAILCDALFSFPKERYLTVFSSAVLFAVLLHELNLSAELKSNKVLPVKLFLGLGLLITIVIGFYRFKGEYYTKELLKFQTAGDARAVLKAGAKAESAFYASDPTSSPIAGYLGAAYYALLRPDSMVMQCQRALELSPYDYESLSNLGFALTRYGDKFEARRVLEEALRINPKYDGARLNLAILDFSQGKYEDAYHQLLEIEEVQTKYPEQFGAIYQAYSEHAQSAQ